MAGTCSPLLPSGTPQPAPATYADVADEKAAATTPAAAAAAAVADAATIATVADAATIATVAAAAANADAAGSVYGCIVLDCPYHTAASHFSMPALCLQLPHNHNIAVAGGLICMGHDETTCRTPW